MGFPKSSNNEAEYEALLHGMRMAKACGCIRLMIYGDSNLVVQQTMKFCDTTTENMITYHELDHAIEGNFDGCELCHIGPKSNKETYILANLGSTKTAVPPDTFLERIEH